MQGCKLDAALQIPELAAQWRKKQPDMLVVDRGSIDFSVGRQMHPMPYDGAEFGSAEAYVTPEGSYGFVRCMRVVCLFACARVANPKSIHVAAHGSEAAVGNLPDDGRQLGLHEQQLRQEQVHERDKGHPVPRVDVVAKGGTAPLTSAT